MKLFVTGISFKTAPVELREQLAVPALAIRCAGCRLKVLGGLSEVVLLSTCNRVEIYGVAADSTPVDKLLGLLARNRVDLSPYIYVHTGEEAVQYLFSVTGGLDSMVLGETEITGQVKNAYESAQALKLTGRITNCLFQKALQAAKAIRTETHIGRGATSVGSVAVQLAEKIFGSGLKQKSVMILGAGQMGESCLRHLAKKGVNSVTVANRSIERARNLASEIHGNAIGLDQCVQALAQTDIVVGAAGGETLLTRQDVQSAMQERPNRPLFFIDIAVPRNIDPEVQYLENVFLYNVDHLEEIVRENVRLRELELAHCREIIDRMTLELLEKIGARPAKAQTQFDPQPAWLLCNPAPCGN